MNYDRRYAERIKISADNKPAKEYIHLVRWVWALIVIAFILALIR